MCQSPVLSNSIGCDSGNEWGGNSVLKIVSWQGSCLKRNCLIMLNPKLGLLQKRASMISANKIQQTYPNETAGLHIITAHRSNDQMFNLLLYYFCIVKHIKLDSVASKSKFWGGNATLNMFCSKTARPLLFHPCCEPSELYWCSAPWYPGELGCQLESAASMGSGRRGTATQQMDPSMVLKLHPPLSTQRNPPRTSQPLVCASVRVCGGHVLAGSHLSTMRIGKRGTSNYVGRHNRWYPIHLWNYIGNALHVTIKCE